MYLLPFTSSPPPITLTLGHRTCWGEGDKLRWRNTRIWASNTQAFSSPALIWITACLAKSREYITCMKVMIHIPCSFRSITLWKNKSRVPSQMLSRSQHHWRKCILTDILLHPRPVVRSYRFVFSVTTGEKENKHRETHDVMRSALHKWSNSETCHAFSGWKSVFLVFPVSSVCIWTDIHKLIMLEGKWLNLQITVFSHPEKDLAYLCPLLIDLKPANRLQTLPYNTYVSWLMTNRSNQLCLTCTLM